jgi:hypothetical protein
LLLLLLLLEEEEEDKHLRDDKEGLFRIRETGQHEYEFARVEEKAPQVVVAGAMVEKVVARMRARCHWNRDRDRTSRRDLTCRDILDCIEAQRTTYLSQCPFNSGR